MWHESGQNALHFRAQPLHSKCPWPHPIRKPSSSGSWNMVRWWTIESCHQFRISEAHLVFEKWHFLNFEDWNPSFVPKNSQKTTAYRRQVDHRKPPGLAQARRNKCCRPIQSLDQGLQLRPFAPAAQVFCAVGCPGFGPWFSAESWSFTCWTFF